MIKGRNVMMGYLADKVKTAQVIDKTGWLHTGDIGKIDKVNHSYCIKSYDHALLFICRMDTYLSQAEIQASP